MLNKNKRGKMSTLLFQSKKQVFFFFKEKFKSVRLALTHATSVELMTEEVIKGKPSPPAFQTLISISRAASEVDDYWRIVKILHKRLVKFNKNKLNKKKLRATYNSLIVVEHLLTHGPLSAAQEFQSDKDVISEMIYFKYIDDNGFNWGQTVGKKAAWILKLLEDETLGQEERNRSARRLSRGIQGFNKHENQSSCSNHSLDMAEAKSHALDMAKAKSHNYTVVLPQTQSGISIS